VTLVIDSSLVVAALVDAGPVGAWAEEQILAATDLAAPHLMPVEVANVLRRAAQRGEITQDTAALAHGDLLRLPVELFSYGPFAARVWELGENVAAYDAWYVAVAESLGATLATLDVRLTKAAGPRCGFSTPDRAS
jgi:predicted nucleic acid-binding protein